MFIKSYLSALSLFGLFWVSGCAAKGDLDNLKQDTEELKSRFFTAEKEMGNIRTEATNNAEHAKKDILKEVEKIRGEFSQIRKTAADLQANLDSGKSEMRGLAGKIDDMSLLLKKPAEDINLLKEDMDRRFSSVNDRLLVIEKNLLELSSGAKKENQSKPSPDADYHKGLELYKQEKFEESRKLLSDFLKNNPDHELSSNAQYWMGETYFSEKNYEQAIIAFQDVIKNYPGKEKIPAAMLKQGMSFAALNDKKSARFIYKKTVEEFPKSEEAKKAAEKLKKLK